MELKFRVRDFNQIRKVIKKLGAKLIDERTEHYVYLKSGNKLQKMKRKYYFVRIRKKGIFFRLAYLKISKHEYDKILKKEIVKRKLNNKREIWKVYSIVVSLNQMEVGKFVILEGNRSSALAKKLGLKNIVTKPFSDL